MNRLESAGLPQSSTQVGFGNDSECPIANGCPCVPSRICKVPCSSSFLSATEYHSDADYNSRRVAVVVVGIVVVVVVQTSKNGLTFERLDQFASYLEGSCTRVGRSTAYAYDGIGSSQPAYPAYQPKSEKCAFFNRFG